MAVLSMPVHYRAKDEIFQPWLQLAQLPLEQEEQLFEPPLVEPLRAKV
jgi:hypothetical protein